MSTGVADIRQRLNDITLIDRRRGKVFLDAVFQPHAGVAQRSPAKLVAIAAVGRVGEEPFLHMRTQQREELLLRRRLHVRQRPRLQAGDQRILLRGCAVGQRCAICCMGGLVEYTQAQAVDLGELTICARKRQVEILDHADLDRAGAGSIGGKHPLEQRGGCARLMRIERKRCHLTLR